MVLGVIRHSDDLDAIFQEIDRQMLNKYADHFTDEDYDMGNLFMPTFGIDDYSYLGHRKHHPHTDHDSLMELMEKCNELRGAKHDNSNF